MDPRFEFVEHRRPQGSAVIEKVFFVAKQAVREAEVLLFGEYCGDIDTIYRQVVDEYKRLTDIGGSRFFISLNITLEIGEFGGKKLRYIQIEKDNANIKKAYAVTYKDIKPIMRGAADIELLACINPVVIDGD